MNFNFKPPRKFRARLGLKRLRLTRFDFQRLISAGTDLLARSRKYRWPVLLGAAALLLSGLAIFQLILPAIETRSELEATTNSPGAPKITKKVIEGEIREGDTITALLGDYFSAQELLALSTESRKVFPLSSICSGQPYKLCVDNGKFESFEYDIDRDERLIITNRKGDLDISRIRIPYTVKEEVVRGTITSSLFEAVGATGESDALAVMLAEIFAYDIDFIREIRGGDTFQVLVEKRFQEGGAAGYGRILGATFTNNGETFTAFLFKDGKNPASYYNADGKALRKAFLKAPLAFSRISSGFTMKRFHPITKKWKAHPAIDYAAPTGTPIMAIGDGAIVKIGRTGGNGNFVKLRHNSGVESMYLHMSRFAKGMSQGKRVRQGQTIGYVGSTGLATGPHLCFRMFRNGSPLNPNKLKTATAAPVSRERLAEFRTAITPRLARLEARDTQHDKVRIAQASPQIR